MKKFMHNIEFMRAFAMVLVVLSHVPIADSVGFNESGSLVLFMNSFVKNGSVMFVFISGFLFYYLNNSRFSYCDYLVKKVKFVFCPYLIIVSISFLIKWYVGFNGFPVYHWSAEEHIVKTYLWSVFSGGYILGPLWFVPMICLFFLSAPIIFRAANSRFALCFLIASLVVTFFTSRPFGSWNPVFSYVHFFGVYFLGVCVAKYEDTVNPILVWDSTLFVLSIVFGASLWMTYTNSLDSYFEMQVVSMRFVVDWSTIQKIVMSLLFFGLTLRLYVRSYTIVKSIADYSFGVFFVHGVCLYFYSKFAFYVGFDGYANAWSYIFIGLVVYVLSHFGVYGVKKYAGSKSKYIIGC